MKEATARSVAPSVWGAAGWRLLHAEAARASASAGATFPELVEALRWLLPCPTCRDNYARHLAAMPLPVAAPAEWPMWVFRLHHKVNGTRPGAGGPRRRTAAMAAPWTPAEIAPFVEAVVETHPGGGRRGVTPEYVRALGVLTAVIREGRAADVEVLRSRPALRRWFREWKKNGRGAEGATPIAVPVGVCRFVPGGPPSGTGGPPTSACSASH